MMDSPVHSTIAKASSVVGVRPDKPDGSISYGEELPLARYDAM